MTQENKELLLKDLCARLPYEVKVFILNKGNIETDIVLSLSNVHYIQMLNLGYIKDCKPYLFPMSSMTEEQKNIYSKLPYHSTEWQFVDWLNKNHFDYRGLIEKGLALDATNKNIY